MTMHTPHGKPTQNPWWFENDTVAEKLPRKDNRETLGIDFDIGYVPTAQPFFNYLLGSSSLKHDLACLSPLARNTTFSHLRRLQEDYLNKPPGEGNSQNRQILSKIEPERAPEIQGICKYKIYKNKDSKKIGFRMEPWQRSLGMKQN